jgi:hypothetical protein
MGVATWVRIGIYSQYADRVRSNIHEERYFEALAVAVVCLDVLVRDLVEGLLLHHKDNLDPAQIQALGRLDEARLTAGAIVSKLKEISVLDTRVVKALEEFNRIRNAPVHPFSCGKVKNNAIMPGKRDDKNRAYCVYRLLCHIIDISGGRSPQKHEREQAAYMRERRKQARLVKGQEGP